MRKPAVGGLAAKAGADVVKFQTFKAELLVTADAPKAEYQQRATGAGESQYAMLKRLGLPRHVPNAGRLLDGNF